MSVHVSDFTKTPEEILVDLINADNGIALSIVQVAFGVPSVAPTGASRDTQVEVFAAPDSGYSGSVVVRYNRVPLNVVPGTRSRNFLIGSAVYLKDLIPVINSRYGIHLTDKDFVNVALPYVAVDTMGSVTLEAAADSLVWRGSVTLGLMPAANTGMFLNTAITDTQLETLGYTAPPTD